MTGVRIDDDVMNSEEVRAAAEEAYPIDDKMSDTRVRQAVFNRIAFRAGAGWYAQSKEG